MGNQVALVMAARKIHLLIEATACSQRDTIVIFELSLIISFLVRAEEQADID